ncbi:hypothetical protein ABT186_23145 [Streptomyces sp. NPDC001634]|uniref:hypothetical protein n=1 Tax=Streptomyces sp. NPDC001634 TaxID=3154390 RepID=UPI0033213723
MQHLADDNQLAQVHLQAAVAHAILGEVKEAERHLDAVLALPVGDLLAMGHAAAAYIHAITGQEGVDWATGEPAEEETRRPVGRATPARGLTLRLMSAWSPEDPESFDALFTEAACVPAAAGDLRDLFVYALEWTEVIAGESVVPQLLVKTVSKALKEHGPKRQLTWDEQESIVADLINGIETLTEEEHEELYKQLDADHQMEVDEAVRNFANNAVGSDDWDR